MKTKHFIYVTIVLLTVIALGSCKKRFPDGPCISFRTATNRLSDNGSAKFWELQKCEVNGVDCTQHYLQEVPFYKAIGFLNRSGHSNWVRTVWPSKDTAEDAIRKGGPLIETYNNTDAIGPWGLDVKSKPATLSMGPFLLYPGTTKVISPYTGDTLNIWSNYYAFYAGKFVKYDVLKLTNKKLTISTDFKGRHFTFYYNEKDEGAYSNP